MQYSAGYVVITLISLISGHNRPQNEGKPRQLVLALNRCGLKTRQNPWTALCQCHSVASVTATQWH